MMRQELISQFGNVFAAGASVPLGTRGLVHVWGRNDMSTTEVLGIHWAVYDPDGSLVEDYEDWSFFGAAPGVEHEFIGGRFDIKKSGNWLIVINLLMNRDSPVIVDTYDGVLCAVVEGWAGTITRKELEYDETRGAIPVY